MNLQTAYPDPKPIRCDYCGCDIKDEEVCTVPTGQNRYDFNYACPECAEFEIEKYNSIEITND
jgi:hypothetical protein